MMQLMVFQYLKASIEEGIGIISLNNPPVNALSALVISELADAFKKFELDPQVRVIIITAEGANFAAGADVKDIQKVEDAKEGEKISLSAQKVLEEIYNSDKPVIAAINGYCLGGGNELVMACHIRIATDKARFGQPEINIGIIPGMGGTQRLPRLIGVARALEMMLTGDLISAQEAKALGLVNMVVPEQELKRQTVGLAKRIASKSACAISTILKAVREGIRTDLASALKIEAGLFGKMMTTLDKKEGIQAFLEKRQAKFVDR